MPIPLEAPTMKGNFLLQFIVESETIEVRGLPFARPKVRFNYESLCQSCKGFRHIDEWWAIALHEFLEEYFDVGISRSKVRACTCADSHVTYRE